MSLRKNNNKVFDWALWSLAASTQLGAFLGWGYCAASLWQKYYRHRNLWR